MSATNYRVVTYGIFQDQLRSPAEDLSELNRYCIQFLDFLLQVGE